MVKIIQKTLLCSACVALLSQSTYGYSNNHITSSPRQQSSFRLYHNVRAAVPDHQDNDEQELCHDGGVTTSRNMFLRQLVSSAFVTTAAAMTPTLAAQADEYGVETEAPTLFTGESVEICKKRGPLGACLETSRRTEANDNDKAKKYFKDPSALIKEKEAAMRGSANEGEGNALIEKLLKQSIENREKNDLDVQIKTFENDQSATFGPFDRQVLILNMDGKTFTLLQNPQAMRLKKAGFIEGRKFVKQPTEEEIAAAASDESSEGGGFFGGLFGGGN